MAGKWVLCGLLALAAVLLLPEACHAYASYTVGDSVGWRLVGAPNYTDWAAKHNYSLGDSLVFNFELNHSVVFTLDQSTYDGCNFTDTDNFTVLAQPGVDTFVNYTLINQGMNYFACPTNESTHCKLGMKFAINVGYGAGLPPSPPAAPPPPERTVPPPPEEQFPADYPPPPNGGSKVASRNNTWVATLVLLLLAMFSI